MSSQVAAAISFLPAPKAEDQLEAEAAEEGEPTEYDYRWPKDDVRKALPGWKEVPDAEPDGIAELTPYALEGKGTTAWF